MTRFRAAFIHLLISGIVAFAMFTVLWFAWYPAPLFRAVGGVDIFMVLLGVDLVLGPTLTLLVFKTGKKSLKLDLTVIAVVQVAAMVYGTWTLFVGRPVYVAALGIRFDVIQANHVEQSDLEVAGKSLPYWGPQWVGIKEATDRKERERVLFSAVAGADYGHMPQYHAPLESMRADILKNAKPIADLRKRNATQDAQITAWLSAHGQTDEMVVYQGLKARAVDMTVILDAKSAKVIGIAPFKPWG